MPDLVEVRVPGISATDLDLIRGYARARGCQNTATATIRFAVEHLAERLRLEHEQEERNACPESGPSFEFP